MPIMRTKAVLSCVLAAIMLVATVLKVSPAEAGTRASHERASGLPLEAHHHHPGHEHTSHGEEPASQHQDDAPAGSCVSICCAAGMACCVALTAALFDMRLSYERLRLHAPFGEMPAGIEPPVPLRPPRAAA